MKLYKVYIEYYNEATDYLNEDGVEFFIDKDVADKHYNSLIEKYGFYRKNQKGDYESCESARHSCPQCGMINPELKRYKTLLIKEYDLNEGDK